MTSRIIRPVERSVITFPGGIGVSNTIYLARRINVAAYREVTAYFRMHPGSVNSPTPSTRLEDFSSVVPRFDHRRVQRRAQCLEDRHVDPS